MLVGGRVASRLHNRRQGEMTEQNQGYYAFNILGQPIERGIFETFTRSTSKKQAT